MMQATAAARGPLRTVKAETQMKRRGRRRSPMRRDAAEGGGLRGRGGVEARGDACRAGDA
jgi:hypothetical protein